jgi:hypothetical protein
MVILDQYVHPAPEEGWPRWMESQIDEADFVIMVCAERYHRRVMGKELSGEGLGIRWEGSLIYNRIYKDKPSGSRFIPVLLEGGEPAHIPNPVQGHSCYCIGALDVSDPGYEGLYRHLTGQEPTPPPELGEIQILPPHPRWLPPNKSPDGPRSARGIAGTGDRMAGHFYISCSSIDGLDFAKRLAARLARGEPSFRVWIEEEQLHPGIVPRDVQIDDAIKTCKCMLFIMTNDSVNYNSQCTPEWYAALKYKRPIIPIRLHRETEAPFRLRPLPHVDFTISFDTGLASLRTQLSWLDTPEAALQALEHRLAVAQHDLPRAEPQEQLRIEGEIQELERQIADQRRLVEDPEGASRRTKDRIDKGLEHERKAEHPAMSQSRAKFIYRPPMIETPRRTPPRESPAISRFGLER